MHHYFSLVFTRDPRSPVSWLIRLWTWGRYSHVALVSPDGQHVIESRHAKGVREIPLAECIDGMEYAIHRIPHPYPQMLYAWARTQIGAEYDYGYLWGFLFRREVQRRSKWSCTELIVWAARKAGHDLFRREFLWRITPQHLYMISED